MDKLATIFSFLACTTVFLVLMYLILEAFPPLNRTEKQMITALQPLLAESLEVNRKANLYQRNRVDAVLRRGWGEHIINGIDSILNLSNSHIEQLKNYQTAQSILEKDTTLYRHFYENIGFDGRKNYAMWSLMSNNVDNLLEPIFVSKHAFSKKLGVQLLKNKVNVMSSRLISHLSSSFTVDATFPTKRLNIDWKHINTSTNQLKGIVYLSPFYEIPQKVAFNVNEKSVITPPKRTSVTHTFTKSGVQPLIITANLEGQILRDTIYIYVK